MQGLFPGIGHREVEGMKLVRLGLREFESQRVKPKTDRPRDWLTFPGLNAPSTSGTRLSRGKV
jgi:hypothetical protein